MQGAGSWADPDDVPGLAHFCEHMLFLVRSRRSLSAGTRTRARARVKTTTCMRVPSLLTQVVSVAQGSEKFPDEAGYNTYLSAHGGGSNAYTAGTETNYFFSVDAAWLEGALDRFAQFFVAPLFNSSGVQREMHAVDSEHRKNLQSDGWRLYSLLKGSAAPGSAFARFGTGDLQTLDIPDIRERLIAFHERYYSANRMRAVILGREGLDELEALATGYLSSVRNTDAAPPPLVSDPFPLERTGRRTLVKPVESVDEVSMYWPLPSEWAEYDAAPSWFLSRLFGYEGEGSLLSTLKQRGLADGVSAGIEASARGFALFSLQVSLLPGTGTDEDVVRNVTRAVYAFANMLRGADDARAERVWREAVQLAEVAFRFPEHGSASGTASGLASSLQRVQPREILRPPSLLQWRADLVRAALARITPERMLSFVFASGVDEGALSQTDPLYGTRYETTALSAAEIAELAAATEPASELHLPAANPWIPTDFDIVDGGRRDQFYNGTGRPGAGFVPKELPVSPGDGDGAAAVERAWWLQDTMFAMPKMEVRATLVTPAADDSARAHVLSTLLVMFVEDTLQERSYDAALAGLGYSLSLLSTTSGFEVSCSGWSHHLPQWTAFVLDAFRSPVLTQRRLEELKASLLQDYDNQERGAKPYSQALYWAAALLHQRKYLLPDLKAEVASVTLDALQQHAAAVRSPLAVNALVHGNVGEAAARALVLQVASTLGADGLEGAAQERRQLVRVPAGTWVYQAEGANPDDVNSAVYVTWQVGLRDHCGADVAPSRRAGDGAQGGVAPQCVTRSVLVDLLGDLLYTPAFDELRTKQQLGYIVFAWASLTAAAFGPGAGAGGGTVVGDVVSDASRALHVVVQGAAADAAQVDLAIAEFALGYADALAQMPQGDFEGTRAALASAKTQRPLNAGAVVARAWAECAAGTFRWTRPEEEAAALRAVSKGDALRMWRQVVGLDDNARAHPAAPLVRRLSVEVWAAGTEMRPPEGAAAAHNVTSIPDFIASSGFISDY